MQSNAGVEIPVSVDFGDVIRIYGGEGTEAGSDLLARLDREGKRGVRVEWYRDGRYWWQGNLDRLRGGLDESTRTVTFIVRVDDTTSAEVAGERVALMRGMFCKVEIPGLVRPDTVVIPRGALREGRTVHLVENGRLTVREVVPQFYSESEIAIESGLSGGETLVLTDVPGAVQGMLLEPVFDPLP
ncbi:MAG: hypothetical protein HY720_00450 [Planctomycetes bacterium]|nr:hypothetical protein [Planctomycetota bacterium]